MATHPTIPIRPVKTLSGLSIPMEEFDEALTQTFLMGALVFLSNGYLNECGTNPQLIMGVASKAGQNGTANGSKKQPVFLAHPDTLFIGNLDGVPSEGSGTGAVTDRGKMYGLTKRASGGRWYVDKSKAVVATSRVVVWRLWDQPIASATGSAVSPVWGDTLPIVVFSFAPGFFQGHRTS